MTSVVPVNTSTSVFDKTHLLWSVLHQPPIYSSVLFFYSIPSKVNVCIFGNDYDTMSYKTNLLNNFYL